MTLKFLGTDYYDLMNTNQALSDSKTLSINSIPPSVSTPSIASIDSTTNTSPEKKKKSKKKKVL